MTILGLYIESNNIAEDAEKKISSVLKNPRKYKGEKKVNKKQKEMKKKMKKGMSYELWDVGAFWDGIPNEKVGKGFGPLPGLLNNSPSSVVRVKKNLPRQIYLKWKIVGWFLGVSSDNRIQLLGSVYCRRGYSPGVLYEFIFK